MNKKIISLLIFLAYFATSPAIAQSNTENMMPLNQIVAIVNDEVISESELRTAMAQMRQDLAARNIPIPPDKILREETLQGVINFRLQLQVAKRAGISLSEKEVEDAMDLIAKSHQFTREQLKEQLILQNVDYQTFRQQIKDQFTINKLQQQMVGSQIKVTDAEIDQFKKNYKKPASDGNVQYHLIDFFIPISEQASTADIDRALNEARSIQKKLTQGANINDITPRYRDLGWRETKDLPELFADQLSILTTQNASSPLRAPNGYHVLKLMETHGGQNPPPSDEQIRQYIARQKFEAILKTSLENLRKQSFIQIMPADDKAPGGL